MEQTESMKKWLAEKGISPQETPRREIYRGWAKPTGWKVYSLTLFSDGEVRIQRRTREKDSERWNDEGAFSMHLSDLVHIAARVPLLLAADEKEAKK